MISLVPVTTPDQARETADLAKRIWWEHYPPIIGDEQVEYMVKHFQTQDKIWQDIKTCGFEYSLIEIDGKPSGYLALKMDSNDRSLFISKLYLEKAARGRGGARQVINSVISRCRRDNLASIWLTVNKHNDKSIAAYSKLGFEIEKAIVTDIGEGFVMDDYVMRMTI